MEIHDVLITTPLDDLHIKGLLPYFHGPQNMAEECIIRSLANITPEVLQLPLRCFPPTFYPATIIGCHNTSCRFCVNQPEFVIDEGVTIGCDLMVHVRVSE